MHLYVSPSAIVTLARGKRTRFFVPQAYFAAARSKIDPLRTHRWRAYQVEHSKASAGGSNGYVGNRRGARAASRPARER